MWDSRLKSVERSQSLGKILRASSFVIYVPAPARLVLASGRSRSRAGAKAPRRSSLRAGGLCVFARRPAAGPLSYIVCQWVRARLGLSALPAPSFSPLRIGPCR